MKSTTTAICTCLLQLSKVNKKKLTSHTNHTSWQHIN